MDAQVGRSGECRSIVLLRLEDDDVQFGSEEEDQSDDGAQRDAHAQGDGLGLVAAEVDGHEGHPDDARRVHGEADEFGLVEILRQIARLDRVHGAHADQEEVEAQRGDQTPGRRVADDEDPRARREELDGVGRLQDQHGDDQHHLDADHGHGDEDLGGEREPARLTRADALLAAGQDAGDPVGLGQQGGEDEREAEAGQDARQGAAETRGDGQERESGQVAQGHADQDDVSQFAGGGLDDGRVVVPGEDGGRRHRGQQAHHRQSHGHDRLGVAPLAKLGRNLFAFYYI